MVVLTPSALFGPYLGRSDLGESRQLGLNILHWLSGLLAAQKTYGADAVFGPVRARAPETVAAHRAYLERFFSRLSAQSSGGGPSGKATTRKAPRLQCVIRSVRWNSRRR